MVASLCAEAISDAVLADLGDDRVAGAGHSGFRLSPAKLADQHRPLLDESTMCVVWNGLSVHLGHTVAFRLLARLAYCGHRRPDADIRCSPAPEDLDHMTLSVQEREDPAAPKMFVTAASQQSELGQMSTVVAAGASTLSEAIASASVAGGLGTEGDGRPQRRRTGGPTKILHPPSAIDPAHAPLDCRQRRRPLPTCERSTNRWSPKPWTNSSYAQRINLPGETDTAPICCVYTATTSTSAR